MSELNRLKEKIEGLNKFHQIEILKLLKSDESCTLNENNNGIFVNLTNLSDGLLVELDKYLEYVQKQEKQLNEIEKQKNILSNTFFTPLKI